MHFALDVSTVLGLLGIGFSLASFVMKRMAALRVLAMAANVCFIGYGFFIHAWAGVVLNSLLLPVNARRLWEIRALTKEIAQASVESPVSQWLLPHMRRRHFKAQDVLFRKGDIADKLIYVAKGELTLAELGVRIASNELIGEIGLFSPDKIRTQTLVAATDGELYEMTDEMLFQLYYQNPKLGFYLMRLLTARLLNDIRRERQQPAAA
jgi:CRP/FNR family transcriptional regulator, cyclic AMP receptor protein